MKKALKNPLFTFFLGAILFCGISVLAYSILAPDVGFSPSDEEWDVDNVKDALDDLRNSVGSFSNISDEDARTLINSLYRIVTTDQELLQSPFWLERFIKNGRSIDYMYSKPEYLTYIFNSSNGMKYLSEAPYAMSLLFNNKYSDLINSPYLSQIDANAVKVPTMTGYTTPSGEVSAATESLAAYLAFDKKSDGSTRSAWVATKYNNGYVQYKFDKPNKIYKFTLENLMDGSSNYVTSFTLQGSKDGSTFVNIYSGSNGSGNNTKRTFIVPTLQDRYQYYRVVVNAKSGNWAGFGEINFYCYDV